VGASTFLSEPAGETNTPRSTGRATVLPVMLMLRFLSLVVLVTTSLLLLFACTAAPVASCTAPLNAACEQKAADSTAVLQKIAAERGTTEDTIANEFVNACEGQLQSDLDQTLSDLEAIADGGAAKKDSSP